MQSTPAARYHMASCFPLFLPFFSSLQGYSCSKTKSYSWFMQEHGFAFISLCRSTLKTTQEDREAGDGLSSQSDRYELKLRPGWSHSWVMVGLGSWSPDSYHVHKVHPMGGRIPPHLGVLNSKPCVLASSFSWNSQCLAVVARWSPEQEVGERWGGGVRNWRYRRLSLFLICI